jgi:hypothetical protein
MSTRQLCLMKLIMNNLLKFNEEYKCHSCFDSLCVQYSNYFSCENWTFILLISTTFFDAAFILVGYSTILFTIILRIMFLLVALSLNDTQIHFSITVSSAVLQSHFYSCTECHYSECHGALSGQVRWAKMTSPEAVFLVMCDPSMNELWAA